MGSVITKVSGLLASEEPLSPSVPFCFVTSQMVDQF